MQAQVETIGQLERRIRVAVPRAQIEAEVENRLKRIARNAKVAGFRPGKAPLKIVAQQYEGQVRHEVIGEAGSRSISDALREQQVRIAGMPRIEAGDASTPEQLEFVATFEVYPDVVVGDISASVIQRPAVQVSDAEVDKTIEILRKQRATYEPVERAAAKGDQVDIDYTGRIDGEVFAGGEAKGYKATLGEGRTLAEFDAGIEGMKAGETRTVPVTFPADYHGKEVAGKTAQFEITLNRVLASKLPEIGPDFAKALGVADGDVAKMREEVRGNIQREVTKRIESKLKEQAMDTLLKATPIAAPKSLVEMEVERLSEHAKQDLAARGINVANMPIPSDLFQEQATRRVTLGLILAEVVKANALDAKPEQVRALVEEYAESYEDPQKFIGWYYENPSRLGEVESLVMERNVVSWVLSKAKVEDQSTSFDELMGIAK